jgi:hypothetical protein
MAGGIFTAVSLQHIPRGPLLTAPLAAVLGLGWLAIAWLVSREAVREGLHRHTRPLIGSFAIGTWVAASAIVVRMAMLAAPDARWLAEALFAATVGLWLWFAPQAVRNLRRIARLPAGDVRPSGVILLTTVATQALALPAVRLFPDALPVREIVHALLALGLACYLAGAVLIFRRYIAGPRWRLATDWDNTNCILHGALSISGFAAVVSDAVGAGVLMAYWMVTLAVFVIVEAFEFARLVARVRGFGWREAVLVYDVSQWARNFTFGMFYAFTAALAGSVAYAELFGALAPVADAVLRFGQYVVLLLLLAELMLMARWFVAGEVRTAVQP